jgi:hypothetical protein
VEGIPVFYEADEEIINTRKVNELNNSMKVCEFVTVYLGLLGLGCNMISYEVHIGPFPNKSAEDGLNWAGLVISLVLCSFITVRYKVKL